MEVAVGVPVWGRVGIRAFAMVDLEDYERVAPARWNLNAYGYVMRNVGGRKHRRAEWLHRVILGLEHGDNRQVDHVNHDPLDNRRANLRIVTDGENKQNLKPRKDCSSQYRGVCWDAARDKWKAEACVAGHRTMIGRFDSELEAAEAARQFRREHMPFCTD